MRTENFTIESRNWLPAYEIQRQFTAGAAARPGTPDYSARCRQLEELGGDCYHVLQMDARSWSLMIGDACGKGLPAALTMSHVQASLRAAAFFGNDLSPLLRSVNRQVYASSPGDGYATLFYAAFDTSTRMLRYVNAGHNPPIIMRQDGSVTWLERGGAPAGMFSDWTYEEGSVQLRSGDLILAYTDGVTESLNRHGEEWGLDGLLNTAAVNRCRCTSDLVDAIFQSMDRFSGGLQHDDATVLAVRV